VAALREMIADASTAPGEVISSFWTPPFCACDGAIWTVLVQQQWNL
jgi:hypothetical protein